MCLYLYIFRESFPKQICFGFPNAKINKNTVSCIKNTIKYAETCKIIQTKRLL